jgi:hypothetical protein
MSAYGLALFDLPVALLKVLDNRISDPVLLIFGQRARTPRTRLSPFRSPIMRVNRRSSILVHIPEDKNK